jgi:hypothetical protein
LEVSKMNAQMQQAPGQNPMTWEQKRNFVVGLMSYPATIAQVFLRRKTGFRLLKPSKLVVLTVIMLGLGRISPPVSDSVPAAEFFAPALSPSPQSSAPPGLDAPLPANWPHLNSGTQAAWLGKHRLNAEQEKARAEGEQKQRERWQADMQAKAERAELWAKFRGYLRGWAMYVFAGAFLLVGLYQRRARWNDLLKGEQWHTYSRGVSHLNRWLDRMLPETWILRFADPLAVCLMGLCALLISRVLGLWLIFSAFALFIVEQAIYEQQLDRVFDVLDGLIDARSVHEVVNAFKKGGEDKAGKGVEENSGVLSTSALIPEALRRRQERDARALAALTEETELTAKVKSTMAQYAPLPEDEVNGHGGGLAASDDRL